VFIVAGCADDFTDRVNAYAGCEIEFAGCADAFADRVIASAERAKAFANGGNGFTQWGLGIT